MTCSSLVSFQAYFDHIITRCRCRSRTLFLSSENSSRAAVTKMHEIEICICIRVEALPQPKRGCVRNEFYSENVCALRGVGTWKSEIGSWKCRSLRPNGAKYPTAKMHWTNCQGTVTDEHHTHSRIQFETQRDATRLQWIMCDVLQFGCESRHRL